MTDFFQLSHGAANKDIVVGKKKMGINHRDKGKLKIKKWKVWKYNDI